MKRSLAQVRANEFKEGCARRFIQVASEVVECDRATPQQLSKSRSPIPLTLPPAPA
ncbi:MAG TPA: hypothetical protein VK211_27390 [Kamptonema sp.]|nr:hypothetical protein [Kamptonema sp.]